MNLKNMKRQDFLVRAFIPVNLDVNVDEAEIDQSNLLKSLVKLNDKSRPKAADHKGKNGNTFESAYALFEDRKLILNAFRGGIFPIKERQGKRLKIITTKQMFQRLPIGFAQVKANNTSKPLLHKIRRIIYSLFQAKKMTK